MATKTGFDRRQIVRVPVETRVSFRVTGDGEHVREGLAVDIGIGGCFIETAEPGSFGEEVRIAIMLAGERYVIDGVVRWIRASGIGVQFKSLGVHETHAITELAREATERSPRSLRRAG